MSRIVQEDLRLVGNPREAAERYLDLKRKRAKTAVRLYETFLKDYVFTIEKDERKIAENLKGFFDKDKIKIVASMVPITRGLGGIV